MSAFSFDVERLYSLIPAIYRVRDGEEAGGALKALLSVLAREIAVLEEDLAQRYDDHFIETCAPWVLPYIGDLIGHQPLHGAVADVSSPRAEIADTLGYRRRKGTAAMLEQLARDVSGWNAAVVEYFLRIAATQYMNHRRAGHAYAPDVRDWKAIERLGTPFDRVPHTVDVRRISTGAGLYNIPNVGVFLWRLPAFSLTGSPAAKVGDRRYRFSPLGIDTNLITRPEREQAVTHLADPINAPLAISRRVLNRYLAGYYGDGKSLYVKLQQTATSAPVDVAPSEIVVCDLNDMSGPGATIGWAHMPQQKIAIDPVLGRIALPPANPPARVLVSFHYAFGGELGGGEYARQQSFEPAPDGASHVRVPVDQPDLTTALAASTARHRIVEIEGSGRHEAAMLALSAPPGGSLQLRAADGCRPLLALGAELRIVGGDDSEISIDGLLVSGGVVRVPAKTNGGTRNTLRRLRIRHCTLVPGRRLQSDGRPAQPGAASLVVDAPNVVVEIDHSIVGTLRIASGCEVHIRDSVVDATSETRVAYADAVDGPGGALVVRDSTIIGKVHTQHLRTASNAILLAGLASGDTSKAPVQSARKQEACIRFSYLPWPSIVGRRFACRPQAAGEVDRVRPRFTSMRYGQPGYVQLSRRCAPEIRCGADDGGEMGALHGTYEWQREENVRTRVNEYLRFGLEAGVLYASDGARGDDDER